MSLQNLGFSRDENGVAHLGGTPLALLLEQTAHFLSKNEKTQFPTPAYFYDLDAIHHTVRSICDAFGEAPHVVAYAVKANSAGSVVREVAAAGAGIDAVSAGELELARRVGVPARKIVLSGVAKRDDEIDYAIQEDILALQAESVTELKRIAARARASNRHARVSLRINPSVMIDSHSHIATGHDAAKFGIARADLANTLSLIAENAAHLRLVGLSTHVGSMLRKTESYLESAEVVCDTALDALRAGFPLEYVDFGGGFGIDYGAGPAAPPSQFAERALSLLRDKGLEKMTLVVEPGRSIVGSFGVVVARVVQEKRSGSRRWLMLDAGMNDLLRPALYQAPHRIEALDRAPGSSNVRVVGPVCESTDDFGEHPIDGCPEYVAIRDAGAYGFVMASEYNARPLPHEVFVKGGRVTHVSASPGIDAWLASRLGA